MKSSSKSQPLHVVKEPQPRKEGRVSQILPVNILNDEGKGVTRDLSPSGIYFETDKHYKVGSAISMTIDLGEPAGTLLRGAGTIVRVEERGPKVGIAVHVTASYAG